MSVLTGDLRDLNVATEVFLVVRARLFGIAYRMLGTVAEAEDVVQEAWLRWQAADRAEVLEPAAYLVSITTRIAINILKSARVRREEYIGPWLPEPLDTSSDPTLGAERGEALELAVLLLLEKLSPAERAAYVLREAFDYSHGQIALTLDVTEVNARQLVSRARKQIVGRRKAVVSKSKRHDLLLTLIEASRGGNVAKLERLFVAEVVSYSDGGGIVQAARLPVRGRAKVAKFLAFFASSWWIDVSVEWVHVNGELAALLRREGRVIPP